MAPSLNEDTNQNETIMRNLESHLKGLERAVKELKLALKLPKSHPKIGGQAETLM